MGVAAFVPRHGAHRRPSLPILWLYLGTLLLVVGMPAGVLLGDLAFDRG
jgi:hypothetical protein